MNPPRAPKEEVSSEFYAKILEPVVGDREMTKALTSDR